MSKFTWLEVFELCGDKRLEAKKKRGDIERELKSVKRKLKSL